MSGQTKLKTLIALSSDYFWIADNNYEEKYMDHRFDRAAALTFVNRYGKHSDQLGQNTSSLCQQFGKANLMARSGGNSVRFLLKDSTVV